MNSNAYHRRRLVVLPVAAMAAALVMGVYPAAAKSHHPAARSRSYLVLDNNGSPVGTYTSPCSKRLGCANGILLSWTTGTCVKSATAVSDRYPPVVGVIMSKSNPAPNYGPLVAPCSKGIKLSWNAKNTLANARFQHNSGPNANVAYLPGHSHGFDLFFQGGEGLLTAEWLRNGKKAGAISVPGTADDVYWYGYSPPASPFVASTGGKSATGSHVRAATPPASSLEYFWRHVASHGTASATAPAGADGVDVGWYLNNFQRGSTRGCVVIGSQAWTSPAMPVEFTTGGDLNSRVNVLQCAMDSSGSPIHFDGADFAWTASADGTHNVLSGVAPTFQGGALSGVAPSAIIAQPPTGTDGFIIGFHLDNYHNTFWTQSGAPISAAAGPKFTKTVTWQG